MSGVGCGFALQSADLLAQSFTGRSLSQTDVEAGLDAFQQLHDRVILPHADGICADSLVGKNAGTQMRMQRAISESGELSEQYLALTGRIVLPADFQRALMRALVRRPADPARPPDPSPAVSSGRSDADR